MSLSSNQLDAFLTLSKTLNFTVAAGQLHITQSALSQRILNLETELETSLFIRSRSGLKLTDTAQELLRYCQTKDSLESELLHRLKSKDSQELAGVIRIGGFSSIMSPIVIPSIAPLIKKNPKLRTHLLTKELDELSSLLKSGEIDFMILDDRLDKEELERIHLGFEKNVLVEHKSYQGGEVYLDHHQEDMVTINYLRKFKKSTKNLQRLFLDDVHGLIQGVHQGLGRAVIPLHLIKQDKNLNILYPKDFLEIPVYLYFYSQPYYTRLHQEVLKALEVGFKELNP